MTDNNLHSASEEDVREMVRMGDAFFEKDYTHEALAFIQNTARTLNYWGGEINLLPEDNTKNKRKKYSFVDLVWLSIVKLLRDFGMEKEKIFVLKNELLQPIDLNSFTDPKGEMRLELEAMLRKEQKLSSAEIKAMLDGYNSLQQEPDTFKLNVLGSYMAHLLGRRRSIQIYVNSEGNHVPYCEVDSNLYRQNADFREFITKPYVSILLSTIIANFFQLPIFFNDSIKEDLLTPEEWKMIKLLRVKKAISAQIKFNENGEMKSVEITTDKYATVESRLMEILLKGGYEELTISTVNGKIVKAVSKEKTKLK